LSREHTSPRDRASWIAYLKLLSVVLINESISMSGGDKRCDAGGAIQTTYVVDY
jgi:hypothetical protein